jgi:hypothetical protein
MITKFDFHFAALAAPHTNNNSEEPCCAVRGDGTG